MAASDSIDISRTRTTVHTDSATQLVRLATGVDFPERVRVTVVPPDGPHLGLLLEVEDGRPIVTAMTFTRRPGGSMISSSLLREQQLQKILDLAVHCVADATRNDILAYELNAGLRPVSPLTALPRVLDEDESRRVGSLAVRSQRGRPVDETTLRKVAEIVKRNDYDPRREIHDEIGASPRTASRWIAEAKRRGLIDEEGMG
jgi:hypothetical protein